ncbi:hypothetical protein JCM10212_005885 [Sporobolomyces blumeae]
MADLMKPLPFPDYAPASSSTPAGPQRVQATHPSRSTSPDDFISTTTAPLRDSSEDRDSARPSFDYQQRQARPRTTSVSPSVTSSVLDRPRPKPHHSGAARPSSFFGAESTLDDDLAASRPSGDWNAEGGSAARGSAVGAPWQRGLGDRDDEERIEASMAGPRGRVGQQNVAALDHGFPAAEPEVLAGSADGRPGSEADAYDHAKRSSFYGLEAHVPPMNGVGRGDSPPRDSTTNPSAPSTRPQTQHSSGSGSGSYSSHSHDQTNRPRYSHAPYAASRAASLYGISGGAVGAAGSGDSASVYPAPAQLMDQSHLQPGNVASLLSHEKTLELYRQNAKKTNDPHIQFEFAAFVMEVVAELEMASAFEKLQHGQTRTGQDSNGGGHRSEPEVDSRRKQKALVAESIALLNKLAQRGHVKSQYFLADCYTQGVGTPKGKRDYDKAFPLFMLAGKHGHADASYRAAQCLEHGWGCRKDLAKSVSLYRRAAVLSHPGSMHRLGLAEINGELGLTKRPKDGVQWLKRAAELADQVDPPQPQSLHELAVLHEKGIDNVVFQDEEYAAELLARAAELQYAPSAYKLGECYEYGRMGCPQDAALSIHYYNIAAQQNHPAACFALTAWYLVGSPGILPQSDTEAYLWAKKSAEAGFAKAEYACGYFTENGIGTYQDQREALEWFRKAASHGDKRAQDRLRSAGQPVPAQVAPPLRHTASSNALAGMPPPVASEKSRLAPPSSSSTKLLTKIKPHQGPTVSEKPRSGSVDRIPRPPPKDVKGKGKQRQEPADRPGFYRQRSNSQPSPARVDQPRANQDFSPLPYGSTMNGYPSATVGNYPQDPYNRRGGPPQQYPQERTFVPLSPDQVRMPVRQHANGSPLNALADQTNARDAGAKKAEREHVLQRRKHGGAEDKDCTIM